MIPCLFLKGRFFMAIDATNEKRFESDIEAAFLSPAGGYTKGAVEPIGDGKKSRDLRNAINAVMHALGAILYREMRQYPQA